MYRASACSPTSEERERGEGERGEGEGEGGEERERGREKGEGEGEGEREGREEEREREEGEREGREERGGEGEGGGGEFDVVSYIVSQLYLEFGDEVCSLPVWRDICTMTLSPERGGGGGEGVREGEGPINSSCAV